MKLENILEMLFELAKKGVIPPELQKDKQNTFKIAMESLKDQGFDNIEKLNSKEILKLSLTLINAATVNHLVQNPKDAPLLRPHLIASVNKLLDACGVKNGEPEADKLRDKLVADLTMIIVATVMKKKYNPESKENFEFSEAQEKEMKLLMKEMYKSLLPNIGSDFEKLYQQNEEKLMEQVKTSVQSPSLRMVPILEVDEEGNVIGVSSSFGVEGTGGSILTPSEIFGMAEEEEFAALFEGLAETMGVEFDSSSPLHKHKSPFDMHRGPTPGGG